MTGDRNKKAVEVAQHELLQNRRRFIELSRRIEKLEVNIEFFKRSTDLRKMQLLSGIIKEKDNFGNIKSKEELQIDIDAAEDKIKDFNIDLMNTLDDFYFFMSDKSKEFPSLVAQHYEKIQDYYKKYRGG